MVIRLALFFLLFLFSINAKEDSLLLKKVRNIVYEDNYNLYNGLIKKIFAVEGEFYKDDKIDLLKVVKTLKSNGLLTLFFDKPQKIKINFKTAPNPILAVKIITDALNSSGFYGYLVLEAIQNYDEFSYSIYLKSEYAPNPIILDEAFKKSGVNINDFIRLGKKEWLYYLDISNSYLNIEKLSLNTIYDLNVGMEAFWFNISDGKEMLIKSKGRNTWYPHIAVYSKELKLLKLYRMNKITENLNISLSDEAYYLKISDIYKLSNIKDGLKLFLKDGK